MNIVQSELAIAAIGLALSCFTITMYLTYKSRVQNAYYERSLNAYKKVKKSYTVSWHIFDFFAVTFVSLSALAIAYVVGGIALDGIIYSVTRDTFRFYILLPAGLFWLFALFSSLGTWFVFYVTRSDGNDKEEEKLAEFDGSISNLVRVTDLAFHPGEICSTTAMYKIIEEGTKNKLGEIRVKRGQAFPPYKKLVVYYVEIN